MDLRSPAVAVAGIDVCVCRSVIPALGAPCLALIVEAIPSARAVWRHLRMVAVRAVAVPRPKKVMALNHLRVGGSDAERHRGDGGQQVLFHGGVHPLSVRT